jgi:hypothetical protein
VDQRTDQSATPDRQHEGERDGREGVHDALVQLAGADVIDHRSDHIAGRDNGQGIDDAGAAADFQRRYQSRQHGDPD